jgi:copper(I)-binding protein
MTRLFLTTLFVTFWSAIALAGGAISIDDPQVRLVPPGNENTAAFMTIRNASDKDVKLIRAESPAAKTVELHSVTEEAGMKKMRPVLDIAIKAGGEAVLKPGDYHIMLIGLNKPLQESEEVPLTLTFDDGSSQSVKAPVRRIHVPMH